MSAQVLTESKVIVCLMCKEETGMTKEHVLSNISNGDIHCPCCDVIMYSCRPQKRETSFVGAHAWSSDYD